jgi:sugar phosphate permease
MPQIPDYADKFTVEGLFSIMVSTALFCFLPEHENFVSGSHQVHVLGNVELSETNESTVVPPGANHTISFRLIWKTLTNITRWPHFIATACVFSTWSPLTTYTPSIIMQLGFTRIEANALAAIGSLLTLPVILFFAWVSDQLRRRGLTVMIAILVYLIALITLRLLLHREGKWEKFGLWTAVNTFAVGYHPIHNAWIQINCKRAEERSISIA